VWISNKLARQREKIILRCFLENSCLSPPNNFGLGGGAFRVGSQTQESTACVCVCVSCVCVVCVSVCRGSIFNENYIIEPSQARRASAIRIKVTMQLSLCQNNALSPPPIGDVEWMSTPCPHHIRAPAPTQLTKLDPILRHVLHKLAQKNFKI
jgi:hypothetical protein